MKSSFSSLSWFVSLTSILVSCSGDTPSARTDNTTTTGGDLTTGGTSGTGLIGSGAGGGSGFNVEGGLIGGPVPGCLSACTDFPKDPILDTGVPNDPGSLFQGSPSGSGPCIVEPQDGSMFPNNWTRPRIHFIGGKGTVYQITMHSDKEANDLVAYTTKDTWIMPKDAWKGLASNVWEQDITVTVRQSSGSGAPSESVSKFQIAPVPAGGSVVYWGSTSTLPGLTTSTLFGFSPGDDGVIVALTPDKVTAKVLDDSPVLKRAEYGAAVGQVRCIGCHTSTPLGDAVAFTNHWPWNITLASIKAGEAGMTPSYVTPMGALIAQLPWQGVTTFSPAAWSDTTRRYISSFAPRTSYSSDPSQSYAIWNMCVGGVCDKTNKDELIWVNLKADGTAPDVSANNSSSLITQALAAAKTTGWDIIARTGDTHGAVTPAWSHDGTTVAYTSTDSTADGHVGTPTICDIYGVPYNGGSGGTAAAIKGASDPTACEYYPTFSADDRYLAFNRVASVGGKPIYYRKDGEIYIARADGSGDAVRLAANDPASCSNEQGNAIFNSWPKWSPLPRTANGKSYYFVVFSSARQSWGTINVSSTPGQMDLEPASQLYMAAVIDDGSGTPKTYPAVYMWNQRNVISGGDAMGVGATVTDTKTTNVTPAWNEFQIPAVPPAMVN